MVAQYTVFGRQVGSHVLAIITLSTAGLTGGYFAFGRGGSKAKDQRPPINAQSKEEEDFITEFIRNAEAEEQKSKR